MKVKLSIYPLFEFKVNATQNEVISGSTGTGGCLVVRILLEVIAKFAGLRLRLLLFLNKKGLCCNCR